MDVLSDAITAIRTGRPHSGRVERHAPFHRLFPPAQGAGFHVVLQGSCWLIRPDDPPLPLAAGDVVFLPHGTSLALADSPSTPLTSEQPSSAPMGPPTVLLCGAYLFDRTRSHPLLGDLPEVIYLPARIGHHPALRTAVELLGAELEQPGAGTDAVVQALLDLLLLQMLRAWLQEQSDSRAGTGWVAALNDPAIAAALHAIHSDLARPWTVHDLGAVAGLSRAAFSRRFTALVGRPPLTYLTWWRMTIAGRLLRASDAALSVIARQVGYGSEFAFASAFKREHGVTTGQYRRAGSSSSPSAVYLEEDEGG